MTVSWQPPTEYTDGTVMTDLAGYHIHYGTQSQDYPSSIQVANPGIATYVVQGLSPGTYYFAVSAYDSNGAESEVSEEIAVTVTGSTTSTSAITANAAFTSRAADTSTGAAASSANAVDPPPSPCATLGLNNPPASAAADSGDENTMAGSSITVGAQSITVSSVTVWINSAQAAPNNQFEVAIYTDNGGHPGSLVAASGSQTIAAQSWNTVPLSATLSASTKYWLLYNTNSTNPGLNELSISPSTTSTAWYSGRPGSAPFGTWPGGAPLGNLESPEQAYSIYLTYQIAASTLGNSATTPPATVDGGDENTMAGSSVTVGAQSISVSSVTVWINSAQAAPNNQFEVAIYTDNGGHPGSLVAVSGSQTIAAQSWNTVPLSATLSANTKYWLLYNTNSTNPSLNELSLTPSATSTGWYSGNPGSAPFGTWPGTAAQGNLESPEQAYSIYLTYQTAALTYQTAASTLGNSTTTPPAAVDGGDENTMAGSSITIGAQSVSVSSVTVWINSAQAAPNNQFEVAIYTDNGGHPGSLVAASGSQTIAAQSWNTVQLSATLSADTKYWLLYNTNSTNPSLNELSLTPSATSTAWYSGRPGSAPFGAWPGTAAQGNLESPEQAYSIYLNYQ